MVSDSDKVLPEQKEAEVIDTETTDVETVENKPVDGTSVEDEPAETEPANEEPKGKSPEDTDTVVADTDEKADEPSDGKVEYIESPYVKSQFLRYGFDEDLSFTDFNKTLSYLTGCGFNNNSLTQARERIFESAILEQAYDPHKDNCRYCDFCGAELTGVEYDIINDGRERCNECSRTVLKTLQEFVDAFSKVRKDIESMFGIRILASIDVKTMDARKLARKLGISFTPSPGFDGRVLGVAINKNGKYSLYVENQSPYLNAVATIAHELTHIWQYVNWDRKAILKKYGKQNDKLIYEGMAKWVEIQYLYFINEPERAYRELCATLQRDDEYGNGLRLYIAEYPLYNSVNIDIRTPFYDVNTPLHDI